MCYSAQIWAGYKKYVRVWGADLTIKQYKRLYWDRDQGFVSYIPKAMDADFANPQTDDEREIKALIDKWDAGQASKFEQEVFKQRKRVADAERTLLTKTTKKALEDLRIGGNKVEQALGKLADLKRTTLEDRDSRIFPDWYASVMIVDDGKRVVKPMRYHCRPAGMPASIDRTKDGKVSGTYNARRDNLERFWRGQFGYTHGVMEVETFYENVENPDGTTRVVQFTPSTGETMLVACLWSHWIDPAGKEPDLLSFAAITDQPEPEVAAAGHDRTIINLKPEHVDAWLNPDPSNRAALYAIFDDKRHPYYEHRLAA